MTGETDLVANEVRALAALGLEALRQEWRRRGWGAPPRLRSAELLRYMIAWRIQVAVYGGLDADSRAALRRKGTARAAELSPGVRLSREWKGVHCEVEVVEGGYRYQGEIYPSLSRVAGHITGTKWNGRRFFGLDQESAA